MHTEDIYGTIKSIHINTGYGGRDKMVKALSGYANHGANIT